MSLTTKPVQLKVSLNGKGKDFELLFPDMNNNRLRYFRIDLSKIQTFTPLPQVVTIQIRPMDSPM